MKSFLNINDEYFVNLDEIKAIEIGESISVFHFKYSDKHIQIPLKKEIVLKSIKLHSKNKNK